MLITAKSKSVSPSNQSLLKRYKNCRKSPMTARWMLRTEEKNPFISCALAIDFQIALTTSAGVFVSILFLCKIQWREALSYQYLWPGLSSDVIKFLALSLYRLDRYISFSINLQTPMSILFTIYEKPPYFNTAHAHAHSGRGQLQAQGQFQIPWQLT